MRRCKFVMWVDNQQVQSMFQVNFILLNLISGQSHASGGAIPLRIALK